MKEHYDYDRIIESLKNVNLTWNDQRKQAVYQRLMTSIQQKDQSKKHRQTVLRFSLSMIVFLSICVGGYFIIFKPEATDTPQLTPDNQLTSAPAADLGESKDEMEQEADIHEAITLLIEAFGEQLQFVSLLAPEEIVKESIKTYYGPFITDQLLEKWLQDPSTAPGRLVSSPWPERIHILEIEKISDEEYLVKGEIIEVSSAGTQPDATYPIQLIVRHIDDKWLIDHVIIETTESGTIRYENTTYGFTFTLPHTWQGYQIIEEEWEGLLLDGSNAKETGPKLLIRHPEWQEAEPRQDIPILVLTHKQWQFIQNEALGIGAAPIPPRALGQNDQYVFALEARYNMAFLPGYEEVEEILENEPLESLEMKP